MAKVEVKCRYCKQTANVMKAGYSILGKRYHRNTCNKYFQLDTVTIHVSHGGVKEQTVEMSIKSSWIKRYKKSSQDRYKNVNPSLKKSRA